MNDFIIEGTLFLYLFVAVLLGNQRASSSITEWADAKQTEGNGWQWVHL